MESFTVVKGIAAPLPLPNIDTDKIIPKQFLKTIKRTGLGVHLFDDLRYDEDRKEIKDFILNDSSYKKSVILIGGENFGCGSSREHAPWALADFGIKSIIAPSFADIFYNNCFKNGILPITIPQEEIDNFIIAAKDKKFFTIDLEQQIIHIENNDSENDVSFKIDKFRKHCMLNGLDDISLTLEHEEKITAFERIQKENKPWLYQDNDTEL